MKEEDKGWILEGRTREGGGEEGGEGGKGGGLARIRGKLERSRKILAKTGGQTGRGKSVNTPLKQMPVEPEGLDRAGISRLSSARFDARQNPSLPPPPPPCDLPTLPCTGCKNRCPPRAL